MCTLYVYVYVRMCTCMCMCVCVYTYVYVCMLGAPVKRYQSRPRGASVAELLSPLLLFVVSLLRPFQPCSPPSGRASRRRTRAPSSRSRPRGSRSRLAFEEWRQLQRPLSRRTALSTEVGLWGLSQLVDFVHSVYSCKAKWYPYSASPNSARPAFEFRYSFLHRQPSILIWRKCVAHARLLAQNQDSRRQNQNSYGYLERIFLSIKRGIFFRECGLSYT